MAYGGYTYGYVADSTASAINVADSGTATTNLLLNATKLLVDPGTATTSLLLDATKLLVDSGTCDTSLTATELQTTTYAFGYQGGGYGAPVTVTVNLADGGTCVTSLSVPQALITYAFGYQVGGYGALVTITTNLADNGSATTNLSLGVQPSSDNGTATDSQQITAAVPLNSTAVASESLAGTANQAFTTDGIAADAVNVFQTRLIALTDDASAGDNAKVTDVQTTVTDTGTANETSTLTITLPGGDQSLTLTDNAVAAITTANVLVALQQGPDYGSANETISVNKNLSLRDAGTSTETLGRITTDSGTSVDRLTTTSVLKLGDSGTATDSLRGITLPKNLADSATCTTTMNVNRPVPFIIRNATHIVTISKPTIIGLASANKTSVTITSAAYKWVTIPPKRGTVTVDYR